MFEMGGVGDGVGFTVEEASLLFSNLVSEQPENTSVAPSTTKTFFKCVRIFPPYILYVP